MPHQRIMKNPKNAAGAAASAAEDWRRYMGGVYWKSVRPARGTAGRRVRPDGAEGRFDLLSTSSAAVRAPPLHSWLRARVPSGLKAGWLGRTEPVAVGADIRAAA
jgi:hypothetical protein